LLAEYVKKCRTNLVGRPFNNDSNGVDNKELIEVNGHRNHPVEVGAWLKRVNDCNEKNSLNRIFFRNYRTGGVLGCVSYH
jgi:hypothetical protein